MTAGAQDDRLAGGRPMTVDDMLRMARFGDVLLSLATGPRAGGALCASWAEGRITASESPKQPQGGPAKAQTTSLRGRAVRVCLGLGLLRRAETL